VTTFDESINHGMQKRQSPKWLRLFRKKTARLFVISLTRGGNPAPSSLPFNGQMRLSFAFANPMQPPSQIDCQTC
jgi:hypothetical protein